MTGTKDHIRGKDILNLIEQLQRERTLVNMRLRRTDMELLTLIDDIQASKKGEVFAVDLHADLREGLSSLDDASLKFEFTDSNKVPCEFTASPAEISDDRIWVLFPDVIYREQKREHFRIEAPLGTRVCFEKNGETYRLNVSDISMGGLLVTVRIRERHQEILSVRERLRDIEIVFPLDRVQIRESVVVRQEERAPNHTVHFGLQFKAIDGNEKRALKAILYNLQREFLARRAGTV
ncbi:MAG: PilZ domain-containing protein [Deltaproteobacteria bacterium]|nr:PilZ domain-containing protein [Deltaproteobacteria bacterium]